MVAEFEAAAGEEQRPAVPETREWREQVMKEAIATLGLEGLHFTESERKDIDRFVAGEIDLAELRRIWDAALPG